jgi:hypothetical protein
MSTFTPTQLSVRQQIINSHALFLKYLDSNNINKLIHLFTNGDIIKYIDDERKIRGLYDPNLTIKSILFGTDKNDSTLLLEIKKNNKVLVHISIHLVAKQFNPQHTGLIHMYKNIHKLKKKNILKKPLLYALIKVEHPVNKPHSLSFSIADGYTTNQSIKNAAKYDPEIQKEMDVIITVLNRIFDEDNKDYYIGDTNKLYYIHNKTNNVLQNINNHSKLSTRKNKGVRMFPNFSLDPPIILNKTNRATTRKINRKHKTKSSIKNNNQNNILNLI